MRRVLLFGVGIFCLAYSSSLVAETGRFSAAEQLSPDRPEAIAPGVQLTPLQHEQLLNKLLDLRHRNAAQKPAVGAGPGTQVSGRAVPETKVGAAEDIISPGSFYIGKNLEYPIVGDARSTVAEPSFDNNGNRWFATMNWNRGYSTNAGSTWTGIPDDAGPADAPLFCCDQDVIHDHGRDRTFYSVLFVDSGLTTGAVRIYVRNYNNLTDKCSYTIDPGAGTLLDYPHLGLGNNYIYLTANRITGGGWSGAIVYRANLDQVAACQSTGFQAFVWTGGVGQVVWTPARSMQDTLYLVTIENTSQLRYFWSPESGTAVNTQLVNVEASNFGAATCTGGKSGNNWMGDTLSTSSIGFQIRSALAHDNGTEYLATYYTVNANPGVGFTQAYAAGVISQTPDSIKGTGFAYLNQADIFNGGACFGIPDVVANARGDLGLSIAFGSSSTGGGPAQGYVAISDDYTRGTTRGFFATVFLVASADDNPTRFGDYFTARTQEPADLAFTGATYGLLSGGINVALTEYVRGRYAQGYLDRRTK